MATKRFASHTESEIVDKKANLVPKNTSKANARAARLLKSYLEDKHEESEFELFEIHRLARTLSHFYLDVRTQEGELYKASSMENLRHSLNRYLKSPPHLVQFDIITNPEFSGANENFKLAMTEIKAAGKGVVDHTPEIDQADLLKMYGSVHLDPKTPTGLANVVQLNIRLYFCRRGNENMDTMTKTTFTVNQYADTNRKYVIKNTDELSKNHREADKEKITGHMPSDPSDPENCPVHLFERYLLKLHPNCDRLWQLPKDTFMEEDTCWFQKRPLGRDTLSKFLPSLSKKIGLSQIYTNHSARATAATILGKGFFSDAQARSVTGHRSSSALAMYQRVGGKEKEVMGDAIRCSIKGQPLQLPGLQALSNPNPVVQPVQLALPSATSSGASFNEQYKVVASGSANELDNFDISELFTEFEDTHSTHGNILKTSNTMRSISRQAMPVFHGCSINNLHITFNTK